MACPAADWEAEIRACVRTVRIPGTATFGRDILQRTDPEIAVDVADIRTRFEALSPADKSVGWFVYEAQWACNRRVRELEIEYRFNVVFENRRGEPRWGEHPLWPDVIAALEAVPEEHLSYRPHPTQPRPTQPMIFRRLGSAPHATTVKQMLTIGGTTVNPTLGEIEIYDPGVISEPSEIGVPTTSSTIRHEIGHSVEPLVDKAKLEQFREQVVGWHDYPWHWIFTQPPDPICDPKYSGNSKEACDLCWELGFLGPDLACDAAALRWFLVKVALSDQVARLVDAGRDAATRVRGNRTYRRDGHFLVSYVTANVPSLPEFWYARTSFTDYFAEVYSFALSRPEWVHQVLPVEQTSWLKEHVFSTRSHYDQIVAPVVAQMGALGTAFQVWAQLQFTKQQLLNVAAVAHRFLQPRTGAPAGSAPPAGSPPPPP